MPNWPLATQTQIPSLFLGHQDLTWCPTGNYRLPAWSSLPWIIECWKYVRRLLWTLLFTYPKGMAVCRQIVSWKVPRTCWSKQLTSVSLNQSCHGFSLITGIGVPAKVSKYQKVSFIAKRIAVPIQMLYMNRNVLVADVHQPQPEAI